MNITAKTKICMVIGDPIEHSLSPQMHNAGYEALSIDNQYVYVGCHVALNNIETFIKGIRTMNIRGVSCTMPHKFAVMQYLDKIDPIAQKIGAVNTIVNEKNKLIGYNTDWIGITKPLEKITTLKNKIVALIGAGGAARAVAFAVTNSGAKLTLYNRTVKKAIEIAKEFNGITYPFETLENIKFADIIINATSIGMDGKNNSVLPGKFINNNHIVFDIVYGYDTKLLREAKKEVHKLFLEQRCFFFKEWNNLNFIPVMKLPKIS